MIKTEQTNPMNPGKKKMTSLERVMLLRSLQSQLVAQFCCAQRKHALQIKGNAKKTLGEVQTFCVCKASKIREKLKGNN